jgi:hypothetical protein
MKRRLKRVDPLSLALNSSALYAFLGLVVAVVALISPARGTNPIFAFLAVVVYPLIGFLASLIGAWLYNLIAGVTGGVLIELSEEI